MGSPTEQPPIYDQSQQLAAMEEVAAAANQQNAHEAKYLSAEWMMNRWDAQHAPVEATPAPASNADILTVKPTLIDMPAAEAPKPNANQQLLYPGAARLATVVESRRSVRQAIGEKFTDSKIAAKGLGLNILDRATDNEIAPGLKEIGGNIKELTKGFKDRGRIAKKRVADRIATYKSGREASAPQREARRATITRAVKDIGRGAVMFATIPAQEASKGAVKASRTTAEYASSKVADTAGLLKTAAEVRQLQNAEAQERAKSAQATSTPKIRIKSKSRVTA